jgi:hypothetical protein
MVDAAHLAQAHRGLLYIVACLGEHEKDTATSVTVDGFQVYQRAFPEKRMQMYQSQEVEDMEQT